MKDLFLGVCMYVYAYLAVTLRNVNLYSCSECQLALALRVSICTSAQESGVTDI